MQITPIILIPFPFYPDDKDNDKKFPYPINTDCPKLCVLKKDEFVKVSKVSNKEKF